MKKHVAIFPGSFDPITLGHIDIIESALKLFEVIIVGVGVNEQKKNMFNVEQRKSFIKSIFKNNHRVIIKDYKNLTVEFCEAEKANCIVRGIRNHIDFEYEKKIALANQKLNHDITTIFIPGNHIYDFVSSTIVRDIINNQRNLKTNLSSFLPEEVIEKIISIS